MPHKSFLTKVLHSVFKFLPESILCVFGNCKAACGGMCMEEDINKIKSTKLKLHLIICHKCWNYYQQMKFVNERIAKTMQSDVNSQYDESREQESVQDLIGKFSKT